MHGDNLNKIIKRMSHEIIENQTNLSDLIIIGIRTRGEFIARRIKNHIKDISGEIIDFGIIDVTFHRDDFRTNLGSPKVGPSEIEVNLDNRPVVLIDDVL